ncbi:MAG: hypothetical protein ACJ72Z_05980, partial [Pyrinomonadaceae bacterium]
MKRRSMIVWAGALVICIAVFGNADAQFLRKAEKIREAGKISQNEVSQSVSTVAAVAPLLVEDFSQPVGTLLTTAGFTAHSAGGTNAITVTAPSLTLTG